MAGISRMTMYALASNPDLIVTYGGPDLKTGRFYGFITLGAEARYRVLVSTPPIFETKENAERAMTKLIEEARVWTDRDLEDNGDIFQKILSPTEYALCQAISCVSHGKCD